MDVDHRLAPVEFLIDRRKGGVAEILVLVTGQQPDAVCLEGVEGILDLPETAVHVWRRNHGKETKAAGMVLSHLGAVFIELARKIPRLLDIISIPDAGLSDRKDEVAIPLLSMSSSDRAGDHFGGGAPVRRPGAIMESTWNWGMKW